MSCRVASTASVTTACSPARARKASLALARELLDVAPPPDRRHPEEPDDFRPPCPCCGGRMIVIERFERWSQPRAPPARKGAEPGERPMTRHGQVARTTAPRRRRVNGMLCARCRGAGRHAHQSRRNQRDRLCDLARKPLPRHAHRILCGSSRQALAHPEAQIPIGNRLRPAGSCMRDFRTPDGTRNPSACRSLSRPSPYPKSGPSSEQARWRLRASFGVETNSAIFL